MNGRASLGWLCLSCLCVRGGRTCVYTPLPQPSSTPLPTDRPHPTPNPHRAYPIPPNLNHLGSDLCRGMLAFAERKPLGPEGLDWLKVHLANLCGKDKVGGLMKWTDRWMGVLGGGVVDG